MLKNIKKRSEGFTIIEVLIVLAIAGLIMVVVFIAVPNLQRNARNNQLETEANNLLTAYSEISNNKGGGVLTASTATAPGTGSDAAKVLGASNAKTFTSATIAAGAAGTASTGQSLTAVQFKTGVRCATDKTSTTPGPGTARTVAMYYQIEGANGNVDQCISN